MPTIKGSLDDGKPIIDIGVSRAAPQAADLGPGAEFSSFQDSHYRALLDTGASISCVCSNVARELDLPQFGIIPMVGGSGPSNHPKHFVTFGVHYDVDSDFEGMGEPTRSYFQLPRVYEVAQIDVNHWFDVIIGTDILREYEFALKKGGRFELILS